MCYLKNLDIELHVDLILEGTLYRYFYDFIVPPNDKATFLTFLSQYYENLWLGTLAVSSLQDNRYKNNKNLR